VERDPHPEAADPPPPNSQPATGHPSRSPGVEPRSGPDYARSAHLAATNIDNLHSIVSTYDTVVKHIFAAGLAVSAALNLHQVENHVAERPRDALDTLDAAASELRTAACTHIFGDTAATPEPAAVLIPDGYRRVSQFSANAVFAYGVGCDIRRAADHSLWAHESEDLLLSARSGRPLARRIGNVFYDIETNAPLYHEDGHGGVDGGT